MWTQYYKLESGALFHTGWGKEGVTLVYQKTSKSLATVAACGKGYAARHIGGGHCFAPKAAVWPCNIKGDDL